MNFFANALRALMAIFLLSLTSACTKIQMPNFTLSNGRCSFGAVKSLKASAELKSPDVVEEKLTVIGRGTRLEYAISDAINQCEQNGWDCRTLQPNSPPVRVIYGKVPDGQYSQIEETEFGPLELKTFTHNSQDEDLQVTLSFDVRK